MSQDSKNRKKRVNMRKLVVINEEELIRQVALRPILYDRSLKAYRKSGLRHQYWKEVGQMMGANLEECRRRWRSLRDAFAKHYKQTSKLGKETAAKRKKWVFYDQMSFIAPFLDNTCFEIADHLLAEYGDNSDDPDDTPPLLSTSSELADNDETTNNNSKQLSTTAKTPMRRRSTVEEEEVPVQEQERAEDERKFPVNPARPESVAPSTTTEQQKNNSEEVVAAPTPTPNCPFSSIAVQETSAFPALDSDEKFLLSCVPALRRLSNRKNALVRLKIQQILFDVEFGSEGS